MSKNIPKRLIRVIRVSEDIDGPELERRCARVMSPKYKHVVVRGEPVFVRSGRIEVAKKIKSGTKEWAAIWLVQSPGIEGLEPQTMLRFTGPTHYKTRCPRVAWVVERGSQPDTAFLGAPFEIEDGEIYSVERLPRYTNAFGPDTAGKPYSFTFVNLSIGGPTA